MAPYHHIVPRFYLANFAHSGIIGRIELQHGANRNKSVRKVGGIEGFYTIPEADDPEIFERELFGKIENKAAKIFNKILTADYWPLNEGDRSILSEYLAVQFLRGNDKRNEQSELATSFNKLEAATKGKVALRRQLQESSIEGITDFDFEEAWNTIMDPETKVQATALGHMRQLLSTFPTVTSYLSVRPWRLVRFTRKTLLTCDTPIALVAPPGTPSFMGIGIGNAYRVLFPISRQCGLVMLTPDEKSGSTHEDLTAGRADREITPTSRQATQFNNYSIINARESIFFHPDDGDLIPGTLPEPRTQEMEAHGLDELMKELIEQGGLLQKHDRGE